MAFIPTIKFLKYKPMIGSDTRGMPKPHNPHKSRCIFSDFDARSIYKKRSGQKNVNKKVRNFAKTTAKIPLDKAGLKKYST